MDQEDGMGRVGYQGHSMESRDTSSFKDTALRRVGGRKAVGGGQGEGPIGRLEQLPLLAQKVPMSRGQGAGKKR